MGYVPAYYINLVIALAILVLFLVSFPLMIQFTIYYWCKGKFLTAILGKDKPLAFKLLKTKTKEGEGEFLEDGQDKFSIDTDQVRLVRYPIAFPKLLSSFQQVIGCSLYIRGSMLPLNWTNPPAGLSSKEAKLILEPHLVANLIKGADEEHAAGIPKNIRMLLMMSVAMNVIIMLAVIYLATKKH
jgi:hypothetical protein